MRMTGGRRLSAGLLCDFFCVCAPPTNVFHGVIALFPRLDSGRRVALVILKRRLVNQLNGFLRRPNFGFDVSLRPSTAPMKASKQYSGSQLWRLWRFEIHKFLVDHGAINSRDVDQSRERAATHATARLRELLRRGRNAEVALSCGEKTPPRAQCWLLPRC